MDDMICQNCSEKMVYDSKRDEYYCPICGCMEYMDIDFEEVNF